MGEGSGRGSGPVRLFVRNRGLGRVNVSPSRVRSGRVQEKWPVDNSGTSLSLLQKSNASWLLC